jgi:hypothetical protein
MKGGCRVGNRSKASVSSAESTIVVPRRSWLEISRWKTGVRQDRKKKEGKEKGKTGKTKDGEMVYPKQPSSTAEIR